MAISGCTVGLDDVVPESPESAAGRIGPAGACATAPPGNPTQAAQSIAPTAAARVNLQLRRIAVSNVLIALLFLALRMSGSCKHFV
jgi:hypothetical protein